jgi:hypothetical protein
MCGQKWADDCGGFKPDPMIATAERLRAILTKKRGANVLAPKVKP